MGEIISELKSVQEFNQITINKFFEEMFEINLSRKELEALEDEYIIHEKE